MQLSILKKKRKGVPYFKDPTTHLSKGSKITFKQDYNFETQLFLNINIFLLKKSVHFSKPVRPLLLF